MKLTIAFNIPEEQEEFELWLRGAEYYSQLDKIDNLLRSKLKHTAMTEAEEKLAETIRDMIDIWR